MSIRTLFVNQISYKTSSDKSILNQRERWISEGLTSLNYVKKHSKNYDMVLIDNTIDSQDELPESVISSLPLGCEVVVDSSLNNFGKINSGAGNIEMLNSFRDILTEYDFYIHHEPRTIIRHSNMFDSFFNDPRNIFRNGSCNDSSDDSQVWTGTYFISTKDLVRFLEWSDLNHMCDQSISIEYYIRTFLDSEGILFDKVQDAGILWNDRSANTVINV